MSEAAKARYEKLTKTPVPQLIARLSVPTILSMLVTALYNAADTFFVGRISTEATAAVGLCFSAMAVIQAFGFFCGQGSGNFLSRRLGAGQQREAEEMAATGLALSFIIGIVTAAAVNLFAEPLAYFLGALDSTVKDAVSYLKIIAIGAPFMMAQFVLNNQLRYQGSAIYAMVGLMCGAVLNIGLDPLLIFVFDLGVKGAALATICGQMISFTVLLIGSRRGANIRIRLSNVRLNPHYLVQIVNGGIPALFRQGLAAAASVLLNRACRVYGDAAIAGMSVTTRVTMFVSSAMIGFGQGYQPVCAFNYGAGKTDRVREGYFFCVRYGTFFLVAMAALCLGFAPSIIGFFRDDPAVIAVGAVALRCQALALPLLACIVITNMMLQSMGKGVKASITASARSGLFFIPLILILPRLFGLFGVEITQAAADVLSISVSIPLARSELKKMKQEKPFKET
ncbi:MAG: MATE family efflux transporter [Lachnospiraceae bacterium]|nr:MATE family efflux transporter [Lachnospiraceae bacterium]